MFAIESQVWINGYNAVINQFNYGTPAVNPHIEDDYRSEWDNGATAARNLYHIA
jgi:hypothetical protein